MEFSKSNTPLAADPRVIKEANEALELLEKYYSAFALSYQTACESNEI